MKILLVEDDPGIGRVVSNGLRVQGFEVDWYKEGMPALEQLEQQDYAAMVLDLMLPDIDGYRVCELIRSNGNRLPVCMLTARDSLQEKLKGFEAGTDDYVVKPFSMDELIARLQVMIRRSPEPQDDNEIVVGRLVIDRSRREVLLGDTPVPFSRREYDVLVCLARNVGHVVTREQLLQDAWSGQVEAASNVVDVYIAYLRKKLASHDSAPSIKTIRGIGYILY